MNLPLYCWVVDLDDLDIEWLQVFVVTNVNVRKKIWAARLLGTRRSTSTFNWRLRCLKHASTKSLTPEECVTSGYLIEKCMQSQVESSTTRWETFQIFRQLDQSHLSTAGKRHVSNDVLRNHCTTIFTLPDHSFELILSPSWPPTWLW